MKKMLMITGCSNSSFWYAGKVGAVVDYLGSDRGEYITREPSGFVNIVKLADAELVDIVPSIPECAPVVDALPVTYRLVLEVKFNKPEQLSALTANSLEREVVSRLRDMLLCRRIDAVVAVC